MAELPVVVIYQFRATFLCDFLVRLLMILRELLRIMSSIQMPRFLG